MTTTWRPAGRARERILAFGRQGTGKSHNILRLARKCPTDTFYYIDNDNTVERLLETEFQDLGVREEYRWKGGNTEGGYERDSEYEQADGNLIVYHAAGWLANKTAMIQAGLRADRNDWIIVDSGTQLWDDVQAWYMETVFGEQMSDHLMELRQMFEKAGGKAGKEGKGTTAMEHMFPEWGFINPEYKQVTNMLLTNPPCHLYVTAELDDIGGKEKDAGVKALYGAYGVKPKGQKRMGHSVQTVLLMTKDRQGEFYMTTVKDRGREELENEGVGNWEMSYMMKRAGWRPKNVDE